MSKERPYDVGGKPALLRRDCDVENRQNCWQLVHLACCVGEAGKYKKYVLVL
jgi:hypothetical protein